MEDLQKQRPGVLTKQEIRAARAVGADAYQKHLEDNAYDRAEASGARQAFPHNLSKQREWKLEFGIGYMIAAEIEIFQALGEPFPPDLERYTP